MAASPQTQRRIQATQSQLFSVFFFGDFYSANPGLVEFLRNVGEGKTYFSNFFALKNLFISSTMRSSMERNSYHMEPLFFWPLLWHVEVLGPGTEPESQLPPTSQLWQCWILNPLCHSGNS